MDFNLRSKQPENYHHYYYGHPLFSEDESLDETLQEADKEFYTSIRTHVIFFISIILLYALSCVLISYFSKYRDEFRLDIMEYRTYRISTWMCTFTLAISIAAFLLLPVSITTNEISLIDDAKTKWSVLNSMWSYVFLFSNLSLFILLPFAYFFTESEGFSGSRRGMLSRLRETCVLLFIVAIIVLGLTYTICCLFFGIGCHISGILSFWQYLPFLYSCISFIGALLLLLCTPLGISHLFTVLYQMDSIQQARKLNFAAITLLITLAGYSIILVSVNTFELLFKFKPLPSTIHSAQFGLQEQTLDSLIEGAGNTDNSNISYYFNSHGGNPVRAFLDITMVLYLWCASLCGLYNLPGLCCLRPRRNNSSFNQIMGNCAVLCLLSSALPLLSRTLGMTNFDLLADFGRIEWLGNFYVVLLYNVIFLLSTTLCLLGKREFVLTIKLFKMVLSNLNTSSHGLLTQSSSSSESSSNSSLQNSPPPSPSIPNPDENKHKLD